MYKKVVMLVVLFIILNIGAKNSSFWGEDRANGLSSLNPSIPNGVYILKNINICKVGHDHGEECKYDKINVKGNAKISLAKILDGQYWLVFQGYSKIRYKNSDITFGCKTGIIDTHIFFNNKQKNEFSFEKSQENEVSVVSSQVRIFENTCLSDSTYFVCDGNFLGDYSYYQISKKLYIYQSRMLNGSRVKMYSEFDKS
ncbi:hypothetical protein [Fluviispira multicolorata]|uniref:Uncharacterized protein n=1 Tax=Fluviispira multicolorata TaxID=2654512 RepID=A0A833JFJ0_9BACT|nr:hypothetical protein [Fluviispira multicolorata]KAB8033335.1 hypothetical protein GCL57_01150 [Fluviispira multicolorata]